MNRLKGSVLLAVLLVIAVATTLTVGYLYFQNQTLKSQINSSPQDQSETPSSSSPPFESPSNQSETPADETVSWKTYTDNKNGFSFRYPGDYFKYQEASDVGTYLAPSKGQGGNGPKFLGENDVWLNLTVEPSSSFSSLEEFLDWNLKQPIYANALKVPINVGGTNAYKVTYNYAAVAGNVKIYNYDVITFKNGMIYLITVSSWSQNSIKEFENTFDQIISTFKFL